MTTFISSVRSKLLGTGIGAPDAPVTNDALLASLATHCDAKTARRARAIVHRLGIHTRYLSRDLAQAHGTIRAGCSAPQLCRDALLTALDETDATMSDVEYLIGHTATPHTLLPPNIAWVSEEMSFAAPYMELRQACTGFANALQTASSMIAANGLKMVAIVGSETGSPYFTATREFATQDQLVNYVQMGDGAGAVILGPDDASNRAIISDLFIGQIGNTKAPGLALDGGGSSEPYCRQGLPVFAHRADVVRQSGATLFTEGVAAIEGCGYRLDEFRFIIPHQANGRMAELLGPALGVSQDVIHVVADRYGNLGSAAIWVALDDLRRSGRLSQGDKVLILGAEATKFLYGGFLYTH